MPPTSEEYSQFLAQSKPAARPVSTPAQSVPAPKTATPPPMDLSLYEGIKQRNAAQKQEQDLARQAEADAKKAAQAKRYGNFAGRAFVRGVQNTMGGLAGLGAIAGELSGIDPLRDAGLESTKAWQDKAAEIPGVQFSEISGPGSAGKWVLEKAIENAPFMIGTLGAAGVSAKLASKIIPKVAGEYLDKLAVKSLGGEAALKNMVAKGMTAEEQSALIGTQANSIAKKLGARAGVIGATAALESGGDYTELTERGLGSDKAALTTLATGIGKGFIETMGGDIRIIDRIMGAETGGIARRAIDRINKAISLGKAPDPANYGVLKRIFGEAARIGREEGLEEVFQEGLALANIGINDPTFKVFAAENLPRILEAGAGGFAVGALMGGPSGMLTSRENYAKSRGWVKPAQEDDIYGTQQEGEEVQENEAEYAREGAPVGEAAKAGEAQAVEEPSVTAPVKIKGATPALLTAMLDENIPAVTEAHASAIAAAAKDDAPLQTLAVDFIARTPDATPELAVNFVKAIKVQTPKTGLTEENTPGITSLSEQMAQYATDKQDSIATELAALPATDTKRKTALEVEQKKWSQWTRRTDLKEEAIRNSGPQEDDLFTIPVKAANPPVEATSPLESTIVPPAPETANLGGIAAPEQSVETAIPDAPPLLPTSMSAPNPEVVAPQRAVRPVPNTVQQGIKGNLVADTSNMMEGFTPEVGVAPQIPPEGETDDVLSKESFQSLSDKYDVAQKRIDARYDELEKQGVSSDDADGGIGDDGVTNFDNMDPTLKTLYAERDRYGDAANHKAVQGARKIVKEVLGEDSALESLYASVDGILAQEYSLAGGPAGTYMMSQYTGKAVRDPKTIEKLTTKIASLIFAKENPGADFWATMGNDLSGLTRKGKENLLLRAKEKAEEINRRMQEFLSEQKPVVVPESARIKTQTPLPLADETQIPIQGEANAEVQAPEETQGQVAPPAVPAIERDTDWHPKFEKKSGHIVLHPEAVTPETMPATWAILGTKVADSEHGKYFDQLGFIGTKSDSPVGARGILDDKSTSVDYDTGNWLDRYREATGVEETDFDKVYQQSRDEIRNYTDGRIFRDKSTRKFYRHDTQEMSPDEIAARQEMDDEHQRLSELGYSDAEIFDIQYSHPEESGFARRLIEQGESEGIRRADEEIRRMAEEQGEDPVEFLDFLSAEEKAAQEAKPAPTAPVPKSAKNPDLTTAITDLTDSATGETIPAGTPHYVLNDGRIFSEKSYRELVDTGAQGELLPSAPKQEKAKEPWEMTRDEFAQHQEKLRRDSIDLFNHGKQGLGPARPDLLNIAEINRLSEVAGISSKEGLEIPQHKLRIMAAIKEGSNIPDKVLREYPDLFEKYGKKPKESAPAEDKQTSLMDELAGQENMFAEKAQTPKKPSLAEEFVASQSPHHVVFYNNKIDDMAYVENPKEQFKYAGMRVSDNLGTGTTPTDVGYIKTPKGEFFRITRGSRAAKKVSAEEVQSGPKYSAAPVSASPQSANLTLADIRKIFPRGAAMQGKDGNFTVIIGSKRVTIKNVEMITPDEAAFELGYGQSSEGMTVKGEYHSGTIKISRTGDIWTLAHESFHWLTDLGLITPKDTAVLNGAVAQKERKPVGKVTEEDRAALVESGLKARDAERGTVVGKIVQKVRDFVDSLVNLFARTHRGVLRDIESGDIFAEETAFWGSGPKYSAVQSYQPKKTVTAYKLFRMKDGKLYPLFVDANTPVPFNIWLEAKAGEMTDAGKVKSKLGPLAYRPGWHAGDLPIATHIGEKENPSDSKPTYRNDDYVWAEVELSDDVDWQKEADSRARIGKNGNPVASTAAITDQVPMHGFYRYKTNPNMTGTWLIGGNMKVTRILSDAEVRSINDAAGTADLPRKQPLDLNKYGFTGTQVKYSASPLSPATTRAEAEADYDEYMPHYLKNAADTVKAFFAGRDKGWPADMKKDLNLVVRSLSVPSQYTKEVPASHRSWEAFNRLPDYQHRNENLMFRSKDGEHKYLESLGNFWKKHGSEAKQVARYIFNRDLNRIGWKVVNIGKKGGPAVFEVRNPQGVAFSTFTAPENTVKSITETEDKAWAFAYSKEAQQTPFTAEGRNALLNYRTISDLQLKFQMQNLRDAISAYEEKGEPLPSVAVGYDEKGKEITVTLEAALLKMGELRGFYMPRIREQGDNFLYAVKEGTNPRLEFFNNEGLMNARFVQLAKQGFKVRKGRNKDVGIEELSRIQSTAAMNDLLSATLTDLEQTVPDEALGIPHFKSELTENPDGTKTLYVTGTFDSAQKQILADISGQAPKKANANGSETWEFRTSEHGGRTYAPNSGTETQIKKRLMEYKDITADSKLAFAKILVAEVADALKSRGAMARGIGRTGAKGKEVVLGYEPDPLRAITIAGKGLARSAAKHRVAREMYEAKMGTDEYTWKTWQKDKGDDWKAYREYVNARKIDIKEQKNANRDWNDMLSELMRGQDGMDAVMGTIRGIASMMYLSFRPAGALVNLTTLGTSGVAAISGYTGVSLGRAAHLLTQQPAAWNAFRNDKTDPETELLFMEIMNRGWHEAQFNKEAVTVLKSRLGQKYDSFIDVGMWMFGAAEKINRIGIIAAAYRAVKETNKDPKMSFDDMLNKAKEISDAANGVYTGANLPSWARGDGIGAQAARSFYVFKTYAHQYLITMTELFMKDGWQAQLSKKGWTGDNANAKIAALWMATATAIFGGAGSSLLFNAVIVGLNLLRDDDPEEKLYAWVMNHFGGYGEQIARFGGAGALNINIKGSLGINLFNFDDYPTTIPELLGAPGSIVTNATEGFGDIRKGDVQKGFEKFLPNAFAAPLKAWRETTTGVTSRSNTPLFYGDEKVQLEPLEAALRTFAFNPARISGIREKQWNEKKMEARFQNERGEIYNRIRAFWNEPPDKRSKKEWMDILVRIDEFNQSVRHSGDRGIGLITPQNIRQARRSTTAVPRKERLRQQDMQAQEEQL